MRKRISVVGTVGLPAKYGGFETLTEHLTSQKAKELDFLVYCSAKAYPKRQKTYNGVSLKYLPLEANGIQSVPYDILSIFHAVFKSDCLLVLGVSGALAIPLVKFFTKRKVVTNIDGLEWKRDKWGKKAKKFLRLSERIAVKFSDAVVADNKVIKDHVLSAYGKQAQLIAYGADHAKRETLKFETIREFPFLEQKYAFKVCRIEPENNIEMILRAFSEYKDLNLVLVGNWEVSDFSRNMRSKYSQFKNIFLLDPIYDQEKLNELRSNSYIYVHGHSAGGTNPSLVEAMALGLSILAYGVNYNKETTENRALYFEDENSLFQVLMDLEYKPLKQIGEELKYIAQKRYTWSDVADQYASVLN